MLGSWFTHSTPSEQIKNMIEMIHKAKLEKRLVVISARCRKKLHGTGLI
jgi:hypothetical protein